MNIVAKTTTHPALVLRHAVDAITTELVRADIAPTSLAVSAAEHYDASVSMNFAARSDFDSAASLFGFDLFGEYEHEESARVTASGVFMGMFVSAGAPAFPTVVADCDSASFN